MQAKTPKQSNKQKPQNTTKEKHYKHSSLKKRSIKERAERKLNGVFHWREKENEKERRGEIDRKRKRILTLNITATEKSKLKLRNLPAQW